jgi:hypothetical protein
METIKAKVIMLPTDSINQVKEGDLFINDSRKHSWGKLEALKCERIAQHGYAWNGSGIKTYINHLYIVTEEEIKEGDWFLQDNRALKHCGNSVSMIACFKDQFGKIHTYHSVIRYKIIATTDPKLKVKVDPKNGYDFRKDVKLLPQPSQSFIKEYCDKGEIEEVEIEVEQPSFHIDSDIDEEDYNPKIKVNPDNTINIKPIKDSWTREEVSNKLYECLGFFAHKHDIFIDGRDITKWIKENL